MNSSVLLTPNTVDYEHSGFYEQVNRTREVGHSIEELGHSIEEVDLILSTRKVPSWIPATHNNNQRKSLQICNSKKMQIFCRDMRQPLLLEKDQKNVPGQ